MDKKIIIARLKKDSEISAEDYTTSLKKDFGTDYDVCVTVSDSDRTEFLIIERNEVNITDLTTKEKQIING